MDPVRRLPTEDEFFGPGATASTSARTLPTEDEFFGAPVQTPDAPTIAGRLGRAFERGALSEANNTELTLNRFLRGFLPEAERTGGAVPVPTFMDDGSGASAAVPFTADQIQSDTRGTLRAVAGRNQEAAALPQRESMRAFNEAKGFGPSTSAFTDDPLGIIAEITAESAPRSIATLLGAAAGGIPGAVAATGLNAYQSEKSGEVLDSLGSQGVDTSDPEALIRAFQGESAAPLQEAEARGTRRGLAVAPLEMLGAALPFKNIVPKSVVGAPIKREAANLAAQTVAQGTVGATGEAAGQLATDQRITNPKAIASEFIGEFGGAVTDSPAIGAKAALGRVRDAAAARRLNSTVPPVESPQPQTAENPPVGLRRPPNEEAAPPGAPAATTPDTIQEAAPEGVVNEPAQTTNPINDRLDDRATARPPDALADVLDESVTTTEGNPAVLKDSTAIADRPKLERKGKSPLSYQRAKLDEEVLSSRERGVYDDAGLDPVDVVNRPADERFAIVSNKTKEKYGFSDIKKDKNHNWIEAIDFVTEAYEGLRNVMKAVDLPDKAASLYGRINLRASAGEPGLGGSYLPGARTITVTRRNQSYAHEWFHALDNVITEQLTGYATTNASNRTPAIGRMSPRVLDAFSNLVEALTGNFPNNTEFRQNAVKLDAGTKEPYFSIPVELAARAFEAYIGASNAKASRPGTDVVARNEAYVGSSKYPQGVDAQAARTAFDELFTALREEGHKSVTKKGDTTATPSNPDRDKLDPQSLKRLAPKAPASLIGKLSKTVKDMRETEIRTYQRDLPAFKQMLKSLAPPKDLKSYLNATHVLSRFWLSGAGADLITVGKRYPKSEMMRTLQRHFVRKPGSGEFAGVIHEDSIFQFVNQMTNRFDDAALEQGFKEGFTEPESKALYRILSGWTPEGVDTKTLARLKRVSVKMRGLLNDMYYKATAAGLDMGYTNEAYMMRVYDVAKMEANKAGFLKAAQKAYLIQDAADREAQAKTAEEGDPVPEPMTDEQALLLADQWYVQKLSGEITDVGATQGSPANFTKSRVFNSDAARAMEAYLITDTPEVLSIYSRILARRIATNNAFSKEDGYDAKRVKDQLIKEGVTLDDANTVMDSLNAMLGRMDNNYHADTKGMAALRTVQAVTTVTLLAKSMLSSIVEPSFLALRSGQTLRNLGKSYSSTIAALMPEALQSENTQARLQLARFIGAITNNVMQSSLASNWGVNEMPVHSFGNKLVTLGMRRNGLSRLTDAQRGGAGVHIGHSYLLGLLEQAADVKADPRDRKFASQDLAELSINGPVGAKLLAFLRPLEGALPTPQQLDSASQTVRETYSTALLAFIDSGIQAAKARHKPVAASTTIGKFAYAFMSFTYAFVDNVIKAQGRLFKAAVTGERGGALLSPRKRAQILANQASAAASIFTLHLLVSSLREAVTNSDRWDEWGEDTWDRVLSGDNLLLTLSRSGFAGTLDPLLNIVTGVKYGRDIASTPAGAAANYWGGNIQTLIRANQLDSDNTPTAEYNRNKALYSLFVAPSIATGLSLAPGSGAASNAVKFFGLYAGTSATTRNDVAKALAEKETGQKVEPRKRKKDD